MARATGISATTVHRIWGAFGLQPHRVESFKLSSDPEFIDKVRDRPLSRPAGPRAGGIDEKSQIQALDRTRRCCRCGRARRSGAAMITSATARPPCSPPSTPPPARFIGSCMKRHRAREFRAFLDDIHVVMDNASSHKTKLIQEFAKRPYWHSHFTPTSASWINQVERFFALL